MLFIRKALALAKLEGGGYGVDATPTGADALLLTDLKVTPMNAEQVKRGVLRSYLGNDESIPAGIHSMVEFECEFQGSGIAGTAPKWGRMVRACGMSETLTAADVAGTAQAGTVRSITLAAGASAVDGFYNGMQLSVTAGANIGVENVITSYVGATKVATLSKTQVTPYGVTSVYAIRANAAYKPISSAFESNTLVCNYDGLQHKILGFRGSVALAVKARALPKLKFKGLGLYQTPTDTGAVVPDYSAFKAPIIANSANTPVIHLQDVAPVVDSLDVDLAAAATYRGLIGGESIQLLDREPTGKIVFEAASIATKDWFTTAKNASLDSLALIHGIAAGFRVGHMAPNVQVKPPTYSDDQGALMYNMDLVLVPGAATGGNDELVIVAS